MICHKDADGGRRKREHSDLKQGYLSVPSPDVIPRWSGLARACHPACYHSMSQVPTEPSQTTALYTQRKQDVDKLCDPSPVTRQSVPYPGNFMR